MGGGWWVVDGGATMISQGNEDDSQCFSSTRKSVAIPQGGLNRI